MIVRFVLTDSLKQAKALKLTILPGFLQPPLPTCSANWPRFDKFLVVALVTYQKMRALWVSFALGAFTWTTTYGQTCENYGSSNGSSCLCPTGFGGPSCSQPACGGNIFQGDQRPLASVSSGFANLTSAGCSCQSGWTGTGCNVCTSSNDCQAAFSSLDQSGDPTSAFGGQSLGNEDPLVCNTAPRVYAAGQLSCQVNVRIWSFSSCVSHG